MLYRGFSQICLAVGAFLSASNSFLRLLKRSERSARIYSMIAGNFVLVSDLYGGLLCLVLIMANRQLNSQNTLTGETKCEKFEPPKN